MGLFSSKDDGKLSDADRRLIALREKGWKGAIDKNGRAVATRTDNKGNPRPLFGK